MMTHRTNLSNSDTSTQAYRITFNKVGCLVIETAVEEAITHGVYIFLVYIFLDGALGGFLTWGKRRTVLTHAWISIESKV